MAEEYDSPRGAIPKLMAAAHRWQSRRGRPPADEGSLPLGREPEKWERAQASLTQQEIDSAERPNLMDVLFGGLGPSQAMFLGAKAARAPHERIAKAMGMLDRGVDPKAVYRATSAGGGALPGISRGFEGKPRWEISDEAMKLAMEKFGKVGSGSRGKVFPLKEIMQHPELYENYPELEKYRMSVSTVPEWFPKGYRDSSFDTANKLIDITSHHSGVKGSVLHELQHAVQDIEGLSPGGTSAFMKYVAKDKLMNSQEQLDRLIKAHIGRGQPVSSLLSTPIARELKGEIAKLQGAINEDAEMHRLYRRLAGEVEARNTDFRQGLSLRDRARNFPSDTEDLPRSMQIGPRKP